MFTFQIYIIHHLIMHILKSLYLSKNSVLEVRDKIMREKKNGEKNKS